MGSFSDPFGTQAGKEERRSSREQRRTSRLQRDIAEQLFEGATEPTLRQFFGGGNRRGIFPQFLETGELPAALDLDLPFGAVREGLEDQFSVARQNIINRTPARGGQLSELLAENEQQRAQAIGTIGLDQAFAEANIRQGLFTQGFNTAFGFPSVSLAGLGSAAGSFSAAANRAAQQQLAREEQAFSNIGLIAGLAAGGGS